jgi:hypothetical protein
MTFLKAQGCGLAGKKDWLRYTEEEPEIYELDELKKVFAKCGPEELLWYDFFLMTGMREEAKRRLDAASLSCCVHRSSLAPMQEVCQERTSLERRAHRRFVSTVSNTLCLHLHWGSSAVSRSRPVRLPTGSLTLLLLAEIDVTLGRNHPNHLSDDFIPVAPHL